MLSKRCVWFLVSITQCNRLYIQHSDVKSNERLMMSYQSLCLFSPLGKPADRAIYFTFPNSFLFYFFFIFYLKIRWTDFRNLYIKWKHFGCRWSICTSFFDISRDVAMATDFVQKWGKIAYPLHLLLWHSETVWAIVLQISALIAPLIALHPVKNGENRSVVFELNQGRKWKLCSDSTEVGLYRRISQQLLNQSLPTLQHW